MLKFYGSCEFRTNDSVIGNSFILVTTWSLLGHVINSELNDGEDIRSRCGGLIGQTNNEFILASKIRARSVIYIRHVAMVCMDVNCDLLSMLR